MASAHSENPATPPHRLADRRGFPTPASVSENATASSSRPPRPQSAGGTRPQTRQTSPSPTRAVIVNNYTSASTPTPKKRSAYTLQVAEQSWVNARLEAAQSADLSPTRSRFADIRSADNESPSASAVYGSHGSSAHVREAFVTPQRSSLPNNGNHHPSTQGRPTAVASSHSGSGSAFTTPQKHNGQNSSAMMSFSPSTPIRPATPPLSAMDDLLRQERDLRRRIEVDWNLRSSRDHARFIEDGTAIEAAFKARMARCRRDVDASPPIFENNNAENVPVLTEAEMRLVARIQELTLEEGHLRRRLRVEWQLGLDDAERRKQASWLVVREMEWHEEHAAASVAERIQFEDDCLCAREVLADKQREHWHLLLLIQIERAECLCRLRLCVDEDKAMDDHFRRPWALLEERSAVLREASEKLEQVYLWDYYDMLQRATEELVHQTTLACVDEEWHYRQRVQHEEEQERTFAWARKALEGLEEVARQTDVINEEGAAFAPHFADLAAAARPQAAQMEEAGNAHRELASDEARAWKNIIDDFTPPALHMTEVTERRLRPAILTEEADNAASLERTQRMINLIAPVDAMVRLSTQFLRCRRFNVWAKWTQNRKKAKQLLAMRLRKMSSANEMVLLKAFYKKLGGFRLMQQQNRRVASLAGKAMQGHSALRFEVWRQVAANRIRERKEGNAARLFLKNSMLTQSSYYRSWEQFRALPHLARILEQSQRALRAAYFQRLQRFARINKALAACEAMGKAASEQRLAFATFRKLRKHAHTQLATRNALPQMIERSEAALRQRYMDRLRLNARGSLVRRVYVPRLAAANDNILRLHFFRAWRKFFAGRVMKRRKDERRREAVEHIHYRADVTLRAKYFFPWLDKMVDRTTEKRRMAQALSLWGKNSAVMQKAIFLVWKAFRAQKRREMRQELCERLMAKNARRFNRRFMLEWSMVSRGPKLECIARFGDRNLLREYYRKLRAFARRKTLFTTYLPQLVATNEKQLLSIRFRTWRAFFSRAAKIRRAEAKRIPVMAAGISRANLLAPYFDKLRRLKAVRSAPPPPVETETITPPSRSFEARCPALNLIASESQTLQRLFGSPSSSPAPSEGNEAKVVTRRPSDDFAKRCPALALVLGPQTLSLFDEASSDQ